jgi:hypothetical protein
VLDTKSLENPGVSRDTLFSLTAHGIPLRSDLNLLLAERNLSFYADSDEVLLITTADAAKAHVVIRVYNVRDLADPPDISISSAPIHATAGAAAGRAAQSQNNSAAGATISPASAMAGLGCMSSPSSQFDSLIELITSTIAPSSWDANGGNGSIAPYGDRLVVAQTEDVHRQLAQLLSELEAARKIPLGDGRPLLRPMLPQEAKIQRALDERIDLDFLGTPLKDVADSIATKAHINVELDATALKDTDSAANPTSGGLGVSPETPLTFSSRGMRLGDALPLLLMQKDLAATIENDVLLITTDDVAKTRVAAVVYPVGKLLDNNSPADPVTGANGPDFDSLIETITSTVDPTTWDSNGGSASIAPFAPGRLLVIAQTPRSHRKIETLLKQLADAKSVAAIAAPPRDEPRLHIFQVQSLVHAATPEETRRNLQTLVDMIRKLIEPESWNTSTTYIGIFSESIVVRQRPAVFGQIQKLIDSLTPRPTGCVGGFGGGGMPVVGSYDSHGSPKTQAHQ